MGKGGPRASGSVGHELDRLYVDMDAAAGAQR